MRRRFKLLVLACAGIVLIFSGCKSASYYTQAVHGQYELWTKQRCIHQLIADSKTCPELKGRLESILEIRAFAEDELRLPATRHYLRYVDLDRPYVLWNLTAAPEFSLESKSWWYPVVGSLTYRGYFSEKSALRSKARLERKGYDVYVGGVRAYSTLGWFADPVLNTFVHDDDAELAELIFHELAHQRFFVRGDTDFNEAFATAVAEEGMRRWLISAGDTEGYANYQKSIRQRDQFVRLVMDARERLEELYERSGSGKSNSKSVRAGKERILADLRNEHQRLKDGEWNGYAGYDRWFANSLNNAKLNSVATYYELVPAFHAVMRANDGDFEKFYAAIGQLAELPKELRHEELAMLIERETLISSTASEERPSTIQ